MQQGTPLVSATVGIGAMSQGLVSRYLARLGWCGEARPVCVGSARNRYAIGDMMCGRTGRGGLVFLEGIGKKGRPLDLIDHIEK